ncbi:MAG: galactokinase family protein [Thermomicrobiales bacterium]
MTDVPEPFARLAAIERRAEELGQASFGPSWAMSRLARASGRIELIGNHLDYNGGPVLAAAIDRQTLVLGGPGTPGTVEVVFADRASGIESIDVTATAGWSGSGNQIVPADYARGVVAALTGRGVSMTGASRLVVAGDVPFGLGVSSSAALCVALTMALAATRPSDLDVVLIAQEAEHRAGTPCGTMDQSASVAGGVILYDGATSEFRHLRPDLGAFTFLLADSGVDRSLAASVYPDRVREAAETLARVNALLKKNHRHLARVSVPAYETVERSGALPPVLLSRLAHVVSETARVAMATKSLRGGDWLEFGRLMSESGRSSAGDYDVSHPRVEELVALLLRQPGVAGARMMGGGGGGSVLALVRSADVGSITAALDAGYHAPHGLLARTDRVLACRFGPAAGVNG